MAMYKLRPTRSAELACSLGPFPLPSEHPALAHLALSRSQVSIQPLLTCDVCSVQSPRGFSKPLASDMKLVSTLNRMRLVASSDYLASVPFRTRDWFMEVITEAGLVSRRNTARSGHVQATSYTLSRARMLTSCTLYTPHWHYRSERMSKTMRRDFRISSRILSFPAAVVAVLSFT